MCRVVGVWGEAPDSTFLHFYTAIFSYLTSATAIERFVSRPLFAAIVFAAFNLSAANASEAAFVAFAQAAFHTFADARFCNSANAARTFHTSS